MAEPYHPPAQSQAPSHARGDGASSAVMASDLDAEMSFLDHLEELRWSLLKGLGGLLVGIIGCIFFRGWIIEEVLMGPTQPNFFMYEFLGINAQEIHLLNRTITGQFFADLGTIVVVGAIVGSPIFVYYLWDFIRPALYPHERKQLRFSSAFASFFFFVGILFGYLILTPLALQFFQGYQISGQILNQFDITRYFSMVSMWALGTGILFELPVAIFILTKLGVVSADSLRRFRKFALIVVLALGAFFTPPDPVSQMLVALPLLGLYELSILLAVYLERKERRRARKEAARAKRKAQQQTEG